MPRRRRVLTPEELALWRQVIETAVPLHRPVAGTEPEVTVQMEGQPPLPPAAPSLTGPALPLSPSPPPRPAVSRLDPLNHGHTAGIDRRTAERFLRGRLEIEARLDLHGMTQETAHGALIGFITRHAEAGRRCVMVITGKGERGEGVLRRAVPQWLNEPGLRRHILSFSHAQPPHGGAGALYVLLKRRRGAAA